jgi:hypothetical protein
MCFRVTPLTAVDQSRLWHAYWNLQRQAAA